MKTRFIIAAVMLLANAICVKAQQFTETRRYQPGLAQQGVVTDQDYFYVINSHSITKHRKSDGLKVSGWDGSTEKNILHLNSGFIIDGKLYCTHSNYPDSPMASSLEIFDTHTLQHIGNHSFGIMNGSLTWANRHNGFWYAGFANYTGKGSSDGRDTKWTVVAKFNDQWQQQESWIFPDTVLKAFTPKSNSGAVWGKDGLLYCTGHDKPEIYVMKIPDYGFTLQLVKIISTPSSGQGIANEYDSQGRMILYGISKTDNQVIVSVLR